MVTFSNVYFKYVPKWTVPSLIFQKLSLGEAPTKPHSRSLFLIFSRRPLVSASLSILGASRPWFGLHKFAFDFGHLLWPPKINSLIHPCHGVTEIVTQTMKTTAVLLLDKTVSSCYCQKIFALYYHISITEPTEGKASVKTRGWN